MSPQVIEETAGEDCQTIESHIKAMQAEMKKSNPNQNIIDDRMKRTSTPRRSLIMSTQIEAVLGQYPALAMDSQGVFAFLVAFVFCSRILQYERC